MKIRKRVVLAVSLPGLLLTGCYVVPVVDQQGHVQYQHYPLPPVGAPAQPNGRQIPAAPVALQARLYPANDLAMQTGMVSGTVTNMMSGKGRFQLNYRGEVLTGEATRVVGEERKGVASAYGPTGGFMTCEYQMNTPYQGAGMCNFSNGARYQVHIGN